MRAAMHVHLREIRDGDLPPLFAQANEPEAVRMAAFTAPDPADWEAFQAHWARLRNDPTVVVRVATGEDGGVLGHAAVYGPPTEREVTYWVGRAYWGRGVATEALRQLLELAPERPLYARAAADNDRSLRVLGKCGFRVTGRERDFAHGRGEETDEVVLRLGADT